jgi:hypothetical protein
VLIIQDYDFSAELLTPKTDDISSTALSILEREFSFPTTVTTVTGTPADDVAVAPVDDLFNWMTVLRPRVTAILIFLAPTRLVTAFDLEIVAETRATRIVIATPKLTPKTIPRVVRHEIGRVMGFDDHWGCVMSRYYVENAVFCIRCRTALLERGISWKPAT